VDGRQQVPIEFASEVPAAMARADASAIEQAVVNLLENAVKYGGDQNQVQVHVQQIGGRATIAVRDQGLGIHSSDLPYVFDKFYRGRTGDRGRPGFGLGLALVRSVARAHGGDATVRTEYSKGSEFSIVLPLIAAQDGHAVSHTRH
jgi:signal transduction histidine kinase